MDELIDRAREWVNENYPNLTGKDYSSKLEETVQELVAIDANTDCADSILWIG